MLFKDEIQLLQFSTTFSVIAKIRCVICQFWKQQSIYDVILHPFYPRATSRLWFRSVRHANHTSTYFNPRYTPQTVKILHNSGKTFTLPWKKKSMHTFILAGRKRRGTKKIKQFFIIIALIY